MAEFSEYAPGTPSWVDLATRDVEGSARFYARLFGWDTADGGPESGGYRICRLGDRQVAGIGPLHASSHPSTWSTYVTVDDVDAAATRTKQAGGAVFLRPADVGDLGRTALLADTTGATVAVWQPRRHHGADLANEPGAFCWNELNTRDTAAAELFYSALFGWEPKTYTDPFSYTEWHLDGRAIAGMTAMKDKVPVEIPAHWLVYFAVADCDAAVATATDAGGTRLVGPVDIPPGRFAVVSDPYGAWFAVIERHAVDG